MNGHRLSSLLAVCFLFLCKPSSALDACAMSSENGGKSSIVVSENLSAGEWGTEDSWRDIADNVQGTFGNTLAYDSPSGDIHITFNITVAGLSAPMPPLLVPFSGNQSIEKEILHNRDIDTDKPDPNPCDPSKNEENGASGGGGSGGGGSTSGSSGGDSGIVGQICAVFGCKIPSTSVRED